MEGDETISVCITMSWNERRQKVLKVTISQAKDEESWLTKKVDWQRELIDEESW